MQSQKFCDKLNEEIKGKKLTKWTRDTSQNQGYPRIRRTVLTKKTLTHKGSKIKVSGKMHADAKLQVVRVKKGSADYRKLKLAAGKGKLEKTYRIKIIHSDGTLASHEGSLTITLPKSFRGKNVLHIDQNGKRTKVKILSKGKKRTITVQSPGLAAQIK